MKDNTLNLLGITIQKLFNYTNDKLGRIARCVYRNNIERLKLKNTDFTIFSQNCIGSIMYHDLGQPFKSPTINLLITPKDFIRFMLKQIIIKSTKNNKKLASGFWTRYIIAVNLGGLLATGDIHWKHQT